jgi:hypothetical protein
MRTLKCEVIGSCGYWNNKSAVGGADVEQALASGFVRRQWSLLVRTCTATTALAEIMEAALGAASVVTAFSGAIRDCCA